MIRTIPLLCLAAALSGCASLTYPLQKCDGYTRRPLNRSMWQWEENGALKQKRADATVIKPGGLAVAYVVEAQTPAAFARFDVTRSYLSCEG